MCNATVLVIDDNPLERKIFETAFAKAGIKAFTLGEPLKAVETVKQLKPNFIVLDLQMPDMTGFEVCRQLKMEEETREIPIVFVSGEDNPDAEAKSIHLGVIDYLHKPVPIEYLVEQVIKHDVIRNIVEAIKPMKNHMRSFYEKYKDGL